MEKVPSKLVYWVVAVIIAAVILYWFFAPRFSGDVPISAVAITIGNVGIHWYGIIIALTLLLGYELFIKRRIKELAVSEDKFVTFLLVLVIMGIIGGRLGYVIQFLSYYKQHVPLIFAVWQGGMSIHGAIVFGVATAYIWARKNKINVLKLLDILSPAMIFGIALGRLGNFFNQELVGVQTNVPWKMYIASTYRPVALVANQYFHPVFLYEMFLDLLILGALLLISRKYHPKPGIVFFLFIGLYSAARFIVEIWRYNEIRYFWGLSLAQIVSAALVLISIATILMIVRPGFLDKRRNI